MAKNGTALIVGAAACLAAVLAPPAQAKVRPLPDFAKRYLDTRLPQYAVPTNIKWTRRMAKKFKKTGAWEPLWVTADFNGDGKRDWAGTLRTRNGGFRIVAIYSKGRRYWHVILRSMKRFSRTDNYLNVGIYLKKPGVVRGVFGEEKPESVRLRHPGIEVVFFEQSSVVFYWNGSGFSKIWTSD